jgi:PKD repeat protein
MRRITFFISLLVVVAVIFIVACESHKDPFSAKNTPPQISSFFFKPDPNLPRISSDSLKFKTGETYLLHLEYTDAEFGGSTDKTLEAHFRFINGSGQISHDQFRNPSREGDELIFGQVPSRFNGDLLFTPDTSGRVQIDFRLSDGVKTSDAGVNVVSVVFFENLAPIPAFTSRPLTQVNPYRLEFNPDASQDRDGDITKAQFIWMFGDNSSPETVLGKSVITHEYALAGQYRARLRIIDDEGKADSTEQFVTTVNQPPVAALSVTCLSANCQIGPSPADITGAAPLRINYDARGSSDPDGPNNKVASFQISFGDGGTAQQDSGTYTYARDGNYRVVLTVKDHLGLASNTERLIQVATPPVAKLTVTPRQGSFPLRCTIDASESQDPFGGELSFQVFIDGQLRYTQSKVEHIFDIPKTTAYLVRLEVESLRNNLRSTINEAVFVTNTPPIADFVYTPQNPQPTVEMVFTSRSRDPDSTDAITNYRWIWGDGTEDAGSNLSSIMHRYNVSRTYLVKLIVTDRFNATGEKEVAIEVR